MFSPSDADTIIADTISHEEFVDVAHRYLDAILGCPHCWYCVGYTEEGGDTPGPKTPPHIEHAEGVRHSVKEEPPPEPKKRPKAPVPPAPPAPPAPKKRPKAAVPHSMAFAVAAVACHIAGGSADFCQKDQQHHHTQKKMRFASPTRSGGASSSSVKDEPHDADNSGAHTSCDAHAAAMPTITELAPAAMHKGLLPIGANQNLKSRVPRPPAGPPPRSLLRAVQTAVCAEAALRLSTTMSFVAETAVCPETAPPTPPPPPRRRRRRRRPAGADTD